MGTAGYCTLDMYKETSTQTNKRRGDLFFALYLVSVVEDEQMGPKHLGSRLFIQFKANILSDK